MPDLTHVPDLTFNDGRTIPQLGLGVFQVDDEIAAEVVRTAIDAGYRHVDSAMIFDNESGVAAGIHASGVDPDEVYVTTKLWNADQGTDSVRAALEASLERLGFEAVDLYLIHWPSPTTGRFVESWAQLVQLHAEGLAGSIGVSNFHEEHLRRAIDATGVVPSINQVELHPYHQQRELREIHEELGIVTQGWSPLGRGGELLADPVITDIAAQFEDVTPAQVVIRWHLQQGFVTIPKSQTASRIAENFDVFGFELDDAQMAAIDGLDRGEDGRIGPNPETATF
jgi:2,5-diketo-D-gluconate reductase A